MNDDSPTFSPLYRQIKARIMQSLEAREWRPGEAIPSEVELAARFRVSQGTVRKAVDELAAEHHLVRRQGKGTYVATHTEERMHFRFLRLYPDDEQPDAYPETRLLECRRARASSEVARMLDLKAGEGTIVLKRLLLFRGQPLVLDDIALPAAIFKGLDASALNRYRGSLYNLFETEFGTRMISAEERLRAVLADDASAPLLEVPPGSPLLSVERVSRTYGDRPVELRRGLYRTERHHYRNHLT